MTSTELKSIVCILLRGIEDANLHECNIGDSGSLKDFENVRLKPLNLHNQIGVYRVIRDFLVFALGRGLYVLVTR